MRKLLYTIIVLAILLPLSIIYVDQQAVYVKPDLPVHKTVLSLHFNTITEPVPTPTPTAIPAVVYIEPTYDIVIETIYFPTAATNEPTPTLSPTPTPTLVPTPAYHSPYFLDRNEVQAFMYEDITDQIPYTSDFKCQQFAQTVIDNAWNKYGVVGRLVQVNTASGGHAVVWFPTVSDGDIYVDATCGDWWAYPDRDNHWFHTEQMNATYHHGFDLEMYGFVVYYQYGK